MLVTGATGRIGFPIARALAHDHDVVGVARCGRAGDVERLRAADVVPLPADVAELDPEAVDNALGRPVTHVFHAAAHIGPEAAADWKRTFEVNAHATGRLIAGCARHGALKGVVFCSSGSTYEYQGARRLHEDDPPGVHLGTYSLSKIAGEAVARRGRRRARRAPDRDPHLLGVRADGRRPADRLERILDGKEVVLHPDRPNRYNPIYEDDYVRLGVRALKVAADPPVTVNWAGSETVSTEEYCRFLGELVGREVRFRHDERAPWPLWPNVTRMHEVLGRTSVPWREGMRRMVAARHPEAMIGPVPAGSDPG